MPMRKVRRADFEEAGDEDVFRKLRADFVADGLAQSATIRDAWRAS